MMLDTLSTNFVDFINYTFSTFSIEPEYSDDEICNLNFHWGH